MILRSKNIESLRRSPRFDHQLHSRMRLVVQSDACSPGSRN
jgi:hypothetical protein